MSARRSGGFDGLVDIHQQLVRNPDVAAPGGTLHPGAAAPPARWTPTFGLTPYRALDPAALALGGTASFHDIEPVHLDAAIRDVVGVEGPVHVAVLSDRLLAAAGVSRLGSRIRARIEDRLSSLDAAGKLARQGAFVGRASQFLTPPHRDWSTAPEKSRRLDHVADAELMLCLFHAVVDGEGLDADAAMNDGLYRIGFIRLTDNARDRLRAPLRALVDQQRLQWRDGLLYPGPDAFLR